MFPIKTGDVAGNNKRVDLGEDLLSEFLFCPIDGRRLARSSATSNLYCKHGMFYIQNGNVIWERKRWE